MRRTMRSQRNPRTGYNQPNILGTAFGMNMFISAVTFNQSYLSPRKQVDTSRAEAGLRGRFPGNSPSLMGS